MTKNFCLTKFLLIALMAISSQYSYASSLSYSGRLVQTNGAPVTGAVNLKFEIAYTSGTGMGSVLCIQSVTGVALTNGVFHTKLNPDCTPQTISDVLASVPPAESVMIKVTNESAVPVKQYSYQALHSVPSSIIADLAKQLPPLGATAAGQILVWNGSKWAAGNETGTGNGTVTSITAGTGLSGGTITTTGTIAIANSGVGTTQLADRSVTDLKIANGITRSKLLNGTPNYVLMNNGTGVISEVAQLAITQGGTGASTVAGAWTNLGIGSSAAYNYTACMPGEVSKFILPGGWSCIADSDSLDNTKLPLNGSVPMSGALDMNNNFIVGVATATAPGHAANKAYVDAAVSGVNASQWTTSGTTIYYNTGNVGAVSAAQANYVLKAGDTMSGSLVLNADPAVALGAATKQYVDTKVATGANQWTESAGSVYRATGNVGIGTSAPSEKLSVVGNIAVSGKVRLQSDNANYVELKAPLALAATLTFNLPGTAGASGNALVTDGAGNLSWATVATSSTSVGGDLTGTIANAQIALGAIVDADVSATAAIAQSKISGLTTDLAGKEPTIAAGVATQYWRGDKTWQALNTTAVSEGTNLYFIKPRVLGTDLAGFVSGAGTVAATDTVLSSIQKLDGNINIGTTTPTSLLEVNSTGNTLVNFSTSDSSKYTGLRLFTQRTDVNETMGSANPTGNNRGWELGANGTNYAGMNSKLTMNYWDGTTWSTPFTIIPSGNVGVGTSTPASKFDIAQGVGTASKDPNGTPVASIRHGTSGVLGLNLETDATGAVNAPFLSWVDGDGDNYRMRMSNGNLQFGTGFFSPYVTFTNAGNVGIGTSTPNSLLQVGTLSASTNSFEFHQGIAGGTFRFTTNANSNWIQSGLDRTNGSSKDLSFGPFNSTTAHMTIQSTGNVGIPLTLPGLHS